MRVTYLIKQRGYFHVEYNDGSIRTFKTTGLNKAKQAALYDAIVTLAA